MKLWVAVLAAGAALAVTASPAHAQMCGSSRPWIVFPAISAGSAVVGSFAGSSTIELFNEERAFPFWSAFLLSSVVTVGLVATYAGLTPECTLSRGANGWIGPVPVASFIVAAAIPGVVLYLSPKRRGGAEAEGAQVSLAPTPRSDGAVAVLSFPF